MLLLKCHTVLQGLAAAGPVLRSMEENSRSDTIAGETDLTLYLLVKGFKLVFYNFCPTLYLLRRWEDTGSP